jgi:hypothetical protein
MYAGRSVERPVLDEQMPRFWSFKTSAFMPVVLSSTLCSTSRRHDSGAQGGANNTEEQTLKGCPLAES